MRVNLDKDKAKSKKEKKEKMELKSWMRQDKQSIFFPSGVKAEHSRQACHGKR
jgi:hypothetical protein